MASLTLNNSVRKKMSLISTLSVPKAMDQQVKRHSIHGITDDIDFVKPHQEIGHLTSEEKHFLLAVERGDIVTVSRILTEHAVEEKMGRQSPSRTVNINCVDPLGRSAILMAIDNENYEMLKLLIDNNVDIKDALLYAVSGEFVEAVELLLDVEEEKWKPGEIHSWDRRPFDSTIFTPDITPLILAAHRDNYEIIKILLDKEACLPIPHDSRCSCEDCKTLLSEDSLLYSYSRINAYRALSSPCLIALSSKDPILTAFQLSWALRRLSKQEHEFKADYEKLKMKCQEFATNLLNHTRSSNELEVLLNHNVNGDPRGKQKTVRLDRLKLAVKLKQKEFVAHPNVQQLLASIWYEGLPGFRRRSAVMQTLEVLKIGILFPVLSVIYILAPCSSLGRMLRTPFIKFICHSASYFFFLFILVLTTMTDWTSNIKPGMMIVLLIFIFALMWNEVKTLYKNGLEEYLSDMWNINDFITTALYLSDIAIHVFLFLSEKGQSIKRNQDRNTYDKFHPKLASEALFSTANIFSTLKIVYIFSINPYLGPLQIVLARVIVDIAKFFLLYVLVLFAFSNGLHHLLSPYSAIQLNVCKNNTTSDECKETPYSKFLNFFETTQTLFWTAFGEVDLKNFSLTHIREPTKFWGMLMYGSFCVISIVVLLNLLIAMMDHSYNQIFKDADVEWKFARSKLWISYFEEGGTVPVPFNIIPTPKSFWYMLKWIYSVLCPKLQEQEFRSKSIHISLNEMRYRNVMKNLVQRYVIARQKKSNEHNAVTEDDINELKQEISAFRCELLQILKESGMKAKTLNDCVSGLPGKKNRFKERQIIRGLSKSVSNSLECTEAELERTLLEDDRRNEQKNTFSEILQPILPIFKKTKIKNIFSRVASKQSESGDDIEYDLKTPDSIKQIPEERIWFTDQQFPDSVEICVDESCARNSEIQFIDDSLDTREHCKC